MKKIFRELFVLIAVPLIFAGCQNAVTPELPPPGMGFFSIKTDTARTILPETNFTGYRLNFYDAGTDVSRFSFSRTNANLGEPIALEPGTYDLKVNAYLDIAQISPAATGEVLGIVITAGESVSKSVTLSPFATGPGIFTWNLTCPVGTTIRFTIIHVDAQGKETLYTTAPISANGSEYNLQSGSYRVVFHLFNGNDEFAVRTEALQIYPGMESKFTATFTPDQFHSGRVQPVVFPDGAGTTATVTLSNLNNNSIYLVKVNTSDSDVSAGETGKVLNQSQGGRSAARQAGSGPGGYTITSPEDSHDYAFRPPVVIGRDKGKVQSRSVARAASNLGDTKQFWVGDLHNPLGGDWEQIPATLKVQGNHSNIWVYNNSITDAQAQAMADKFDIIYPAETNLLGYEYGGNGGNGGLDGDPRIQILVYDFAGTAFGRFMQQDRYTQSECDGYFVGAGIKTNEAEILYIDSEKTNQNPVTVYSVLIHEFQHMILYNRKLFEAGLLPESTEFFSRMDELHDPEPWYPEMLAQMTEDVMASYIDLSPTDPGHVIYQRIPTFLVMPNSQGVTEWAGSGYAITCGFGAYLLRNYGGVRLLKEIMDNNLYGVASLSAALNEISPGMDFEQALLRWGEALIFSGQPVPGGVMTFDKTVTDTINGFSYTVEAFNVWTGFPPYRPSPYDLSQQLPIPGNSLILYTDPTAWQNKSGDLSITLEKPTNPDVAFFLMVK